MSELVIFVVPFYKFSAAQFLEPMMSMPGVQLGIITQDPVHYFPHEMRERVPIYQVEEITSYENLLHAARAFQPKYGRPRRILAINEQIQVPVAQVREALGVDGMSVDTIVGFRDKARMKTLFREGGVPCARHVGASSKEQARKFLQEVGFPVVVKPIDGAAAQATFKVKSPDMLEEILHASSPSKERPLQIEEFIQGEEHSFETISIEGKHLWHSLTHYHPTPLNVVRNPWIQWNIISPQDLSDPVYDDIKSAGRKALSCLGMRTGLTHLEWFRREDGTVAINEVAARPPGAQIVTLINRAHDIDLFKIWSEIMVWDHLPHLPERKYATGAVFLRGLGGARVQDVEGLEILREFGDMVTDTSLPYSGQAAANSYEGEGYVIVRHPETRRVKEALEAITESVRVRMV